MFGVAVLQTGAASRVDSFNISGALRAHQSVGGPAYETRGTGELHYVCFHWQFYLHQLPYQFLVFNFQQRIAIAEHSQ